MYNMLLTLSLIRKGEYLLLLNSCANNSRLLQASTKSNASERNYALLQIRGYAPSQYIKWRIWQAYIRRRPINLIKNLKVLGMMKEWPMSSIYLTKNCRTNSIGENWSNGPMQCWDWWLVRWKSRGILAGDYRIFLCNFLRELIISTFH